MRTVSRFLVLALASILVIALLAPAVSAQEINKDKWKKIGGVAAAGAAVGALTKGKKGAAVGALAGGAGGYVWHKQGKRKNQLRATSKKSSAKMIGATAVAGAATGALIGGKKGALIGAGAGGAGGYVLDKKTKRRVRR